MSASLPSSSPALRPGGHVILYDDGCPLCTFQVRTLTWLDWLNQFRFVALSDPEATRIAPQLTRHDLHEAIHCIATDGTIHRGARCIRFAGLRIPLLLPVGLFLYLPGVIQVAEVVYRFVSRNRLVFSRIFGCKGACALLPERRRDPSSPP